MNKQKYYLMLEKFQQVIGNNFGEKYYEEDMEAITAALIDKVTSVIVLECIKLKKHKFKETCTVAENFGKAIEEMIVKKYRKCMEMEL